MFEVLMGAMEGRARWRTMPWMVLLFGIVVVPLWAIRAGVLPRKVRLMRDLKSAGPQNGALRQQ
jgi:hypothetical protein